MGKWSESNWDIELVRKIKIMFDDLSEKLRKDNPDRNITFEEFVKSLDTDDKVTRRVFDYLVKETFSKNGAPLTNNRDTSTTVHVLPPLIATTTGNNNSSLHFIPLPEGFLPSLVASQSSSSASSSALRG
eukprot:TRINITY_DN14718_c0_g1_i1.p1 TRINITY_DN14718_c0_g1~~TRINITY_DN14718_c0_g1_i1.p1  ORF type:complete len:130 (+),score=23.32 TRINITY_DN14718_c0_g1_i1:252-641(+)